jgi:hypothetical protein
MKYISYQKGRTTPVLDDPVTDLINKNALKY